MVVYGFQVTLHMAFGNAVPPREIMGAMTMIAMTGGFIAVFGRLADHGRRDLRVMLDLTSALAHQRDESEIIERLDRRLHDAVGGRVRSIALRDADGDFQLIRWHSPERRRLDRASHRGGPGRHGAGRPRSSPPGRRSPTRPRPGRTPSRRSGCPTGRGRSRSCRSSSRGSWVGVLPVLWATDRIPTRHELRLLYGLAGHVGLALAQGQLQQAREDAATDPLTRLLNRRAIGDELAAFVARARAGRPGSAILFCDLDGFKAVNDRRGHDAGDEVLRTSARRCAGRSAQGDVVGRYGGDELLVVAADADGRRRGALAHRVRAAVRAGPPATGVDMTIGIAVFPATATTDARAAWWPRTRRCTAGKLRGAGNGSSRASDESPEALAG